MEDMGDLTFFSAHVNEKANLFDVFYTYSGYVSNLKKRYSTAHFFSFYPKHEPRCGAPIDLSKQTPQGSKPINYTIYLIF